MALGSRLRQFDRIHVPGETVMKLKFLAPLLALLLGGCISLWLIVKNRSDNPHASQTANHGQEPATASALDGSQAENSTLKGDPSQNKGQMVSPGELTLLLHPERPTDSVYLRLQEIQDDSRIQFGSRHEESLFIMNEMIQLHKEHRTDAGITEPLLGMIARLACMEHKTGSTKTGDIALDFMLSLTDSDELMMFAIKLRRMESEFKSGITDSWLKDSRVRDNLDVRPLLEP
jgi:hypothetical protein